MNYRIAEVGGWVVVNPSGKAENNEPLRVRHLFRRWLAQPGVHVIINLKQLEQFGVWEVGLLISFKKEIAQRGERAGRRFSIRRARKIERESGAVEELMLRF